MGLNLDDVIVAISSSPGPAARGVIRLSGEQLLEVLNRLFPSVDFSLRWTRGSPFAEAASLDLGLGQSIAGKLLVWPTHRSYTRQPSAEFHTLGSAVILNLAVEAAGIAGARLANRGEFTLRAFLAGRIDLTQAEAVLGLIDAESEESFQVALRQSSGGLATPFSELRHVIIDVLAEIEATLDFIDQDIEFISRDSLVQKLQQAIDQVRLLQSQIFDRGELTETGTVVLVGDPNAGKSSLFNRIAGASLAIVSPQAGTTRDALRCRVEYGNQIFELLDTAGLEGSNSSKDDFPNAPGGSDSTASSEVEVAAQRHTHRRLREADVVVWCVPLRQLRQESLRVRPVARQGSQLLRVATQADLAADVDLPANWIATSAMTGAGVDILLERIAEALWAKNSSGTEVMPATAVRCRESVRAIGASLEQALNAAIHGWGEELVAAELRVALDNLGQIAGTVYNDEILGRIFSRFCIGK
jgi:tRNA modification GTPase